MPDVRCASEGEHVSHPAPCLSKRIPCVPTLAPAPPLQGSAHCIPLERHGSARRAPRHFVQGYLVLAHLARTRPRLFGHHPRSPVPVATTYIRAVALQSCQSTGVLEMPSIAAHHLLGAPPSPRVPANPTSSLVASPRCRPHAGAIAASTRPSNPACSGLAQLRCARH